MTMPQPPQTVTGTLQPPPTRPLRTLLNLNLNPTGIAGSLAAIWALGVMIWNATHHHGVIDPQVVVSGLAAVAFLYTRFKVTPSADPRDGNGAPLSVATNTFRLSIGGATAPTSSGATTFPTTVMTGGATGSPLTGTEHPADGTMSPPVSNP